jgi:hypothetical protein
MKIKLLIILTILFFSNIANSQQNKWPYFDYSDVKAFMYNLESNTSSSYAFIQNGKINKSVTSPGSSLTNEQANELISIINFEDKGLFEGLTKTFVPHHAFVFFDSDGQPVASLMISFDGEAVRLQPEMKDNKLENKLTNQLTKQETNDQSKKLAKFRKIIEENGFPVLNSPIEYQKLKQSRTRALVMPTHSLQLKGKNAIKQLNDNYKKRFDLSGIVKAMNKIFVIADKEWDNSIYQIDTSQNNFSLSIFQKFNVDYKFDIEGVEWANGKFYIIDETKNEVYTLKLGQPNLEKLEIPWQAYGIDRSGWDNNGFEGIAIDSANQILYLAKEREERRLFRIDLKTMKISEPFADLIRYGCGHDISDMKYENGYIYLLERGLGFITRINCQTDEKLSVSFQDFDFKNGHRIYENSNPQFGMAEALLLTKDEIWIGQDNNGDPVSDYGLSLGLKAGNKPIITIFKRPVGF